MKIGDIVEVLPNYNGSLRRVIGTTGVITTITKGVTYTILVDFSYPTLQICESFKECELKLILDSTKKELI